MIKRKQYSKAANKLIRGLVLHEGITSGCVSFSQQDGRFFMEYDLKRGFVAIPLTREKWGIVFS